MGGRTRRKRGRGRGRGRGRRWKEAKASWATHLLASARHLDLHTIAPLSRDRDPPHYVRRHPLAELVSLCGHLVRRSKKDNSLGRRRGGGGGGYDGVALGDNGCNSSLRTHDQRGHRRDRRLRRDVAHPILYPPNSLIGLCLSDRPTVKEHGLRASQQNGSQKRLCLVCDNSKASGERGKSTQRSVLHIGNTCRGLSPCEPFRLATTNPHASVAWRRAHIRQVDNSDNENTESCFDSCHLDNDATISFHGHRVAGSSIGFEFLTEEKN